VIQLPPGKIGYWFELFRPGIEKIRKGRVNLRTRTWEGEKAPVLFGFIVTEYHLFPRREVLRILEKEKIITGILACLNL